MPLELSDVERIAQLAQLEISDAQVRKTAEQLNNILAMVEQLRSIDTTGIEPLAHPISAFKDDVALRLRDDVVTEENHRAEYQAPAPAVENGLYLVPKVIE
ncbi:Asp-tRNA(Asn)/Glu-tRNA(Gln) amidotransferase subunit GatC [Oxalobacter paraformigenes]|uniref:Aspartyl/glutamyl-tRNA(Asn/Gln) amidotransferase subunit C n=1 Tax=Oxalobacter paraformigenes TaxID=556268 RepID=C3X4J5_9BURK|nr:Asp-tRNA(Asn)/Glu-tRNA(Gln) amidotransferase subunit GatC [Oxalobacter paraformigenes]EEO28131.1 aspartyl/glutamyl-tRNA(Asn/Gln) amidotransferase, C subunit [Oxalobacter paraformigenes]